MTNRSPLTAAELSVMQLLWKEERLSAREVLDRLYPDSATSQHGTVQRLLQRLEDKGFVRRDRGAPVQQFSALVSHEDYVGAELESLAEQLTGGSLTPLVTHLVESRKFSKSELARLRRILDEK
jgi:predicted transcriptional regulator